ncbi:hypothetical protein CDD82_1139 [Ophiocordyceps australis]|uniref:CCHC-type domain-containing protein n=1 Tax=Ophiocordyceps australis TaxID=1399860 RepID=A0A2C5ZN64_9HYPO|nr:hypothetical protein CDD82_1139 [Ophiocordyceps australis]
MAQPDNPGQIIVIDSSDQESLPSRRKRSGSSSVSSSPRHVKKPRTGSDSFKLHESEEGEVQSSDYQSTASMGRQRKSLSGSDSERHPSAGKTSQPVVVMPLIPTYWTSKQGARFKIPAFAEPLGDSWPNRFTNWVRVFFINNLETRSAITPNLSITAFEYYLDNVSGIKMSRKKKSKQAARECQKTGQLKAQLASLRGHSAQNNPQLAVEHQSPHERASGPQVQPVEPAKVDASASPSSSSLIKAPMSRPPAPTGSDEHAQQLKYFPSATDPSKVCILCGQESHLAAACPQSACRFCNGGHWEFVCPTKARCASCLQLGHDAHACSNDKSQPKPAIEESIPCAFCESRNHWDSECPEVCRSYRPDTSTVKKVEQLPISCAICASRDHYLYDCDLRLTPAITVWSYTHYSQYLDPECGVPGIEATHANDSKTRADENARGFKGLGRPSRPNTIKYYQDPHTAPHAALQLPGLGPQLLVPKHLHKVKHQCASIYSNVRQGLQTLLQVIPSLVETRIAGTRVNHQVVVRMGIAGHEEGVGEAEAEVEVEVAGVVNKQA